jgi:hypothetical protein
MRKGILSLMMPNQRKSKSKNIQLAEQKANGVAEKAAQEPLPPQQPQLEMPVEEPFVQTVYVPKTPSLLKAVHKQHDEMAKKSRRQTT